MRGRRGAHSRISADFGPIGHWCPYDSSTAVAALRAFAAYRQVLHVARAWTARAPASLDLVFVPARSPRTVPRRANTLAACGARARASRDADDYDAGHEGRRSASGSSRCCSPREPSADDRAASGRQESSDTGPAVAPVRLRVGCLVAVCGVGVPPLSGRECWPQGQLHQTLLPRVGGHELATSS